eukprot:1176818-Prorocentrum_minimum.AAC.2
MSDSEDELPTTSGKRRGVVMDNEAEDSEVDSSEDEGDDGIDAYEEDGFVVSGDDEEDEDGGRERYARGFPRPKLLMYRPYACKRRRDCVQIHGRFTILPSSCMHKRNPGGLNTVRLGGGPLMCLCGLCFGVVVFDGAPFSSEKRHKKKKKRKNMTLEEDDYDLLEENNVSGFRRPVQVRKPL